jgi:5-methyltetrahydropteroyltriglutamate--homocysteine methyltransferase
MKIKGEEILLPVTNIGSWPRPTWMKGRVFGTATEADFPSFEVREKFEDCVRLTIQDQERLGFDVITDGSQYYESATPFDYEVGFHHIASRTGGTVPYGLLRRSRDGRSSTSSPSWASWSGSGRSSVPSWRS